MVASIARVEESIFNVRVFAADKLIGFDAVIVFCFKFNMYQHMIYNLEY